MAARAHLSHIIAGLRSVGKGTSPGRPPGSRRLRWAPRIRSQLNRPNAMADPSGQLAPSGAATEQGIGSRSDPRCLATDGCRPLLLGARRLQGARDTRALIHPLAPRGVAGGVPRNASSFGPRHAPPSVPFALGSRLRRHRRGLTRPVALSSFRQPPARDSETRVRRGLALASLVHVVEHRSAAGVAGGCSPPAV